MVLIAMPETRQSQSKAELSKVDDNIAIREGMYESSIACSSRRCKSAVSRDAR